MRKKIVNPKHPFSYVEGEVPESYKCQICGATHVKLWRKYQTLVCDNTLVCASCLSRMHKEDGFTPIFSQTKDGGRWLNRYGQLRSDSIGNYVPAVPTEENDTFWGYTSVPKKGCDWWSKLPNGM
ncbi:MAG: hypothetical protein IJ660_07460 [Alphaproteobacteria bacterium]|nr:hypothetical protein [Alphaproteobacteria bacterium]